MWNSKAHLYAAVHCCVHADTGDPKMCNIVKLAAEAFLHLNSQEKAIPEVSSENV